MRKLPTQFDPIGGVPPARLNEVIPYLKHPDRVAFRLASNRIDATYSLFAFPNRKSLARAIRKQQSGPPGNLDLSPVVKLLDHEGF